MAQRILLIEDNLNDQRVESYVLKKLGFEVTSVSNGFDALQLLINGDASQVKFDLVLLDIFLPQLNGISFLRRLTSVQGYNTEVPVIVVSGYSEKKDISTCLKLGAKDFMVKPVDPEILEKKVKSVLGVQSEEWVEVKFSDSPKYLGHIHMPIKLVSINETAVTLSSTVPLAAEEIFSISSAFFAEELGMPDLFVKIIDCSKVVGEYISHCEFVAMKNADAQEIRLLVRRIYAEYKEQNRIRSEQLTSGEEADSDKTTSN